MLDTETVFSLSGLVAMAGWLVLAAGVLLRRPLLRDVVARQAIPATLAVVYVVLIAGWWSAGEGGFGSLADVAALFRTPELLLAGWVHYLAFDLLVGTWIAEAAERAGMPRIAILLLLPPTFLFGPLGLLLYLALRPLVGRTLAGDRP